MFMMLAFLYAREPVAAIVPLSSYDKRRLVVSGWHDT
jgi:hypothetical protein